MATTWRRTPTNCSAISPADWNRVVGIRGGGLLQEPVERLVALERRHTLARRESHREALLVLEAGEIDSKDRKCPRHRVEIRRHAGTRVGYLGRLVADGAVQVAVRIVGTADAAQIDQLELLLRLDHVVRLEVTEQKAAVMQVPDGREDLEDVGDRLRDREGRTFLLTVTGAHLAQRFTADVLHDDVAEVVMLHEVVDLDDLWMLHLGQESSFRNGGRHSGFVAGVEKTLQDDPAVRDVLVLGQIDPPQSTVRDASGDQVLAGHEVTGPQLRREGVRLAVMRAEPFGASRARPTAATDGVVAIGAEPLALRDLRVDHQDGLRIAVGHGRHFDQPSPEVPPAPARACGRGRGRTTRGCGRGGESPDGARPASLRPCSRSAPPRRRREGPEQAARRWPQSPALRRPNRTGRSNRPLWSPRNRAARSSRPRHRRCSRLSVWAAGDTGAGATSAAGG